MEKQRSNNIKKVFFYLLVIGLCVPLIQYFTHFSNEKALRGAIVEPAIPVLKLDSLNNGAFQEQYDRYFNEKFGFRASFIRLHNQFKYWLYNKAQANGVIIGKKGYLYEYNYIKAFYGHDFIGEDSIQKNVNRLLYIQETLKSMNKTLIVVLAPGKGSYYPAYFPDSCKTKVGKTNYVTYLKELRKQQVVHLDLKSWFLKMKKTTKYPLFAQSGIHWSKYGELIAIDSLTKFMEKTTKKSFPQIKITSIEISEENKDGDYDIGEGLNLMFQTATFPMAYPKFEIKYPERNTHRTTFIADSYYWGSFNLGFSQSLFSNGKFWFYNNEVYPDHYEKPTLAADIDFKKEIEENEVIVLLSTDANLSRFPFGFSELFIKYFPPQKPIE